MAQLTNKLYIAKNGVIHEVTSYTTQEEGTPLTINGGSCWKIKNNGVDAYIGLWPTSVSGGTLHSHLKIKKDGIEYWVEKYVENNLVVTINQSENQIIKVTCNGTVYTSSFSTIYNSTYTATITASTGYIAGTLSSSSGTVTSNITISATPATKRQVTITINQTPNQTIKVTANGVEHTSTFTVDYGTPWTAIVVGDTGYNPGTLSNSTGTATSNTTISATAATVKTYTVTINQTSNQTITVTANGQNYTSSFIADYGTTWTATVTSSTGFNPGTLSASSGTVTSNTTISASAASLKTYTLKLNATSNQTITLKYKNRNSTNTGYESEVTVTSTSSEQSFTVRHGTTWEASVSGIGDYNPGTLSPGTSGTVTAATTISVSEAILNSCMITADNTYYDIQKIYVIDLARPDVPMLIFNDGLGIKLDYGASWTARIQLVDPDYNPGTLSPSSGIITSNVHISVTRPTLKTYTLTLNATSNQTITLKYKNRNSTNTGYESEVTVTSTSSEQSFTVRHGTTWTASITSVDTGYSAGTISASSGTVTGNTTISASAVSPLTYTVTVNIPTNAVIKVNNTNATSSNRVFTFNYGDSVTIKAVPNTGFSIDKITVT